MRNATTWLAAGILVVLAVSGCMLPPTATPVPISDTTPAPVVDAMQPPPSTAAPAPTQAISNPTSAPQPTALVEPAIVDRWQLSDLPAMGRNPSDIAVLGDTVFVANWGTQNVSILQDNAVVQVVPILGDPKAMVADPARHRVYLVCGTYEEPNITVISPKGEQAVWPFAEPLDHLAWAGRQLAAVAYNPTRLLLIDPESGRLSNEVPILDVHVVGHMVGDPEGSRVFLYIDANDVETLVAYDTLTGELVGQVDMPEGVRGLGLAPDGSRLYAPVYGWGEQDYCLALDTATMDTIARLDLPASPDGVAVSSMSGHIAILMDDVGAWVLNQDLNLVMETSFASANCAAYGDQGALYVADDEDTVTIYNPVLSSWPPTIALSARYSGLAVDPINGRVLVSLLNQDQVVVLDQHGAEQARWATGNRPEALTVWPGQDTIAVIEQGENKVALFDQTGQVVARYDTNNYPSGAMVDIVAQRLVAGGTVINAQTSSTRALTTTVYLGQEARPYQTVMDTRRQRLYGLVWNGIPGSNGGTIIRLMDAPEASTGPEQLGWRSVANAVYDEEHDQFLVTWTHMGTHGLAVLDAENGRTVHELPLAEGYPTAMALNPASRHLWIATTSTAYYDDETNHKLVGYDTRTMARIHESDLGMRIDLMAADPNLMRIYMASEEAGALFILQDMVDRDVAPPQGPPTVTPIPTQGPIPTLPPPPTHTPAPTPCALQPHPVLALVASLDDAGCPLAAGATTSLAVQSFEHGRMIWREDTGEIMVLLDTGILMRIEDTWQQGMPNQACDAGAAPEGLWQPIRGFGKVWCEVPELRSELGWATDPEASAVGIVQQFIVGEFLHINGGETLFLSDQGAWKTIGQ